MKTMGSAFWFASFIHIVSAFGAFSTQSAHAQDLKVSGQELVEEERWMAAFYDLEYAMRELMWHQSMSALASYGDYNSYMRADGSTIGSDVARLKDQISLNKTSLGGFKRALRRSASLPAEDVARAESILVLYSEFLTTAKHVAALLEESDTQAANLAYRDHSVPLSKEIGASLFSLRRAAQDRFRERAKNFR